MVGFLPGPQCLDVVSFLVGLRTAEDWSEQILVISMDVASAFDAVRAEILGDTLHWKWARDKDVPGSGFGKPNVPLTPLVPQGVGGWRKTNSHPGAAAVQWRTAEWWEIMKSAGRAAPTKLGGIRRKIGHDQLAWLGQGQS